VGRGRQVRHRRFYGRGGPVDQRAAVQQTFVNVFSACGCAYGQQGKKLGSAATRNQQIQSHTGPEQEDLRRYTSTVPILTEI